MSILINIALAIVAYFLATNLLSLIGIVGALNVIISLIAAVAMFLADFGRRFDRI